MINRLFTTLLLVLLVSACNDNTTEPYPPKLPNEVSWVTRQALENEICRTKLSGALLPGSVAKFNEDLVCVVSLNDKAYHQKEFELLKDGQPIEWLDTSLDNIPDNAVTGAFSKKGHILYICRVDSDGREVIGKTRPNHKACLYPLNGKESKNPNYQILVLKR